MSVFRLYLRCLSAPSKFLQPSTQCTKHNCLVSNQQSSVEKEQKTSTFASMLRNSSFVSMGNHSNVPVVGKVFQVQDENLYVDFGGKFYFVSSLPNRLKSEERSLYKRGSYVLAELNDFELSARFLGATQDTTLLEADGKIVGMLDPKRKIIKFLTQPMRLSKTVSNNDEQSTTVDEQTLNSKTEENLNVNNDVDDQVAFNNIVKENEK